MKRAIMTLLFIVFVVSSAFAEEFWASRNSNKYHYPSCKWARKIKYRNLIRFDSPRAAIAAGYVPCKVCRPPLPLR